MNPATKQKDWRSSKSWDHCSHGSRASCHSELSANALSSALSFPGLSELAALQTMLFPTGAA